MTLPAMLRLLLAFGNGGALANAAAALDARRAEDEAMAALEANLRRRETRSAA
jgi:hypothetical protein